MSSLSFIFTSKIKQTVAAAIIGFVFLVIDSRNAMNTMILSLNNLVAFLRSPLYQVLAWQTIAIHPNLHIEQLHNKHPRTLLHDSLQI